MYLLQLKEKAEVTTYEVKYITKMEKMEITT